MEEVKKLLTSLYPEDRISQMIDDAIPNFVDTGDSDYNGDDYEWYHEYCNGEAEVHVRYEIRVAINAIIPDLNPFEVDRLIREHDEQLDVQ